MKITSENVQHTARVEFDARDYVTYSGAKAEAVAVLVKWNWSADGWTQTSATLYYFRLRKDGTRYAAPNDTWLWSMHPERSDFADAIEASRPAYEPVVRAAVTP